MRIRPVEPGDAEAVGDVFLAARAGMTYLPALHTEDETRAFIRDVLMPHDEVWVAEEDGRVIGFAALGDDFVRHLYVLPRGAEPRRGRQRSSSWRRNGGRRGCSSGCSSETSARAASTSGTGSRSTELTDGSRNEEREPDARYVWKPGS